MHGRTLAGSPAPSPGYGLPSQLYSPSFSAMLQDIFQETQSEILASQNRSHSHRHSSSSSTGGGASSLSRSRSLGSPREIPDETQRFEPFLDRAVSYISSILAEEEGEEDPAAHEPFMSLNEFVAYQAKAQEVAALLKEDSPALSLEVRSLANAVSPDSALIGLSEESISQGGQVSAALDLFSCLDMKPNSFPETVYFPAANPPVAFDSPSDMFSCAKLPSFSMSESTTSTLPGVQLIDQPKVQGQEDSHRDSKDKGKSVKEEEQVSKADEWGLKSTAHRGNNTSKREKALKPRKESTGACKRSGTKTRSNKEEEQDLVDLNDLLLQSAQAVGGNNIKRAREILTKVKQHASPYGNGTQRIAYYFAEALDARFSGTGWPLYLGLLRRRPSLAEILKATCVFMASCPFVKASHYFINQTILDAAKGASKLHILELQITGFQYPSLFEALAARPGGPPVVHITGIGLPHYSVMPARTEMILEGVQKTGRQLAKYAASCGVPFEYTAWAGGRESLQMQDFVNQERGKDEVLVVISAYLLRYIMDETLDSPIARLRLLRQGRSINPNVYIQGIVTGAYNTPFFTKRFRDALFHFESLFDMLDTFIERENADRVVFESEILGKAILNIVACEGTEVLERVDRYKHWKAISEEVGFKQLPLNDDIKNNVQMMLNTWHKEYTVSVDSQYMLMGWKGRMLHAMSTWKASD